MLLGCCLLLIVMGYLIMVGVSVSELVCEIYVGVLEVFLIIVFLLVDYIVFGYIYWL